MANSSKDNRFEDYFTLEDNDAKCDICYASLIIVTIEWRTIRMHLKTVHNYQCKISPDDIHEDWMSQYYEIRNNRIKCKWNQLHCDKIYYPHHTKHNSKIHLESLHNISKDTAKKICEWLHEEYKFDESCAEQYYCKRCDKAIPNKAVYLMKHLFEAHEIDPSKNKEMGFSIYSKISTNLISGKAWVIEYFTQNVELRQATCIICDEVFELCENFKNLDNHITQYHEKNYQPKSQKDYYIPFTQNKVKCISCHKIFTIYFHPSDKMEKHLLEYHQLYKNKAAELLTLVSKNFDITIFQTSKCTICNDYFQERTLFKLLIHFKKKHNNVTISPYIIPEKLSSKLSSLFNSDRSVQDIPPCSNQQPTSSHNVNYSSLEIRPAGYAENVTPSSSNQPPTQRSDQSSDSDNVNDKIHPSSQIRRWWE